MPPTPRALPPTQFDGQPDWVALLRAALLHDLPAMAAIAQQLPVGGIPRAGHLACHPLAPPESHPNRAASDHRTCLCVGDLGAQHSQVVCDALEQHLHHQERRSAQPHIDSEPERAKLVRALRETQRRLDRLYTSERPGGLDNIDVHLARLHAAVKDHLAPQVSAERSAAGPSAVTAPDQGWWAGLGNRQRAKILAWALVATRGRAHPLLAGQPIATRGLLRFWYQRRAAIRASRLGLAADPYGPDPGHHPVALSST